jgi:hypothetical protein
VAHSVVGNLTADGEPTHERAEPERVSAARTSGFSALIETNSLDPTKPHQPPSARASKASHFAPDGVRRGPCLA